MDQKVGGTIQFKVDGEVYLAKGAFTYNLGTPKRETVVGSDQIHGYKEVPQPAFIEGAITDTPTLNLKTLTSFKSSTVVLSLANGKVISLRDAWFAGEGTVDTDEGEIAVRFEGKSAVEVQ